MVWRGQVFVLELPVFQQAALASDVGLSSPHSHHACVNHTLTVLYQLQPPTPCIHSNYSLHYFGVHSLGPALCGSIGSCF
ncbi:hypothetical protein K432DRAFT_55678 [Lepidopterella palustris CBS 459.81]|uniref:Secreted protein n=1 Tax=Lepidopterella palustris CBS 459.81 TaxID=1314670 RepID=A0A8E2EA20_9PEZI|nr:hypothetical protein K432DRAFT_55678 [Lepidopterella palustris CBS 459.81]